MTQEEVTNFQYTELCKRLGDAIYRREVLAQTINGILAEISKLDSTLAAMNDLKKKLDEETKVNEPKEPSETNPVTN